MQKGAIYLEQDYIANRREYILRARNSFSESRKDTNEELINTGKAAIWKVKMAALYLPFCGVCFM